METSTVAAPFSGVQAPHPADGLGGGDGAVAMNVAGMAAHPLDGRKAWLFQAAERASYVWPEPLSHRSSILTRISLGRRRGGYLLS